MKTVWSLNGVCDLLLVFADYGENDNEDQTYWDGHKQDKECRHIWKKFNKSFKCFCGKNLQNDQNHFSIL